MIVLNSKIFSDNCRGASVLEVLLAMAIVAIATPFVYSQIAKTNRTVHDIAIARKIMSTRDAALNFVRMNQDAWPDNAQIKLDDTELDTISTDAAAGFIDKYAVNGAIITDVYLAFVAADTGLRTNEIARHIGTDAAVVSDDGVAYGNSWAVAAPDFIPGDLIYRISRDIAGTDTSIYLHRGTMGEDGLNMMQRDLDMAKHHVYNVASLNGKSARARNINVTFIDSTDVVADNVYFSSGANLDNDASVFGNIRVTGDISGFRNIYADNLNGRGYTTTGHIITDRATIYNSINVANNFTLKSDSTRTISAFAGISASSVLAPYISAEEMIFYDNFGLTVSGELLMSTSTPLKLGNWSFPSTKPPAFKSFNVSRATRPAMPSRGEFNAIMRSGWQATDTYSPPTFQQTYISTIN
ncbi:MAG: hypothetical protein IKB10_02775 [Alphaproteobacteria bacterium]|nr:hypothetical protein [Alphaproteobacteria bacterium]